MSHELKEAAIISRQQRTAPSLVQPDALQHRQIITSLTSFSPADLTNAIWELFVDSDIVSIVTIKKSMHL